jgi:hypothetical protein
MSRLGQKFQKRVQTLGNKIQTKSRVLGQKSNEALRMADVGLRKTSNTLKNVIAPGAGLIGSAVGQPEIGAIGYGAGMLASSQIQNLRKQIEPARKVADRLEKLNLRKEGQQLAQNIADNLANEETAFL